MAGDRRDHRDAGDARDRPIPASPAVERYSPPSEPRNDWSRHEGGSEPATTPERWYEPAVVPGTVPTTPVQPATSGSGRSGRGGLATLLAASVLSAVLASSGTVLALRASGVLDRPDTGPGRPDRYHGRCHQSADHRELGHHRCRRRGQPGGRPDHDRWRCRYLDRHHPRDRRRVGRDLRRRRLDPHEPPRRGGQQQPRGRAQRWPRPRWHRLRHRHPDRPRDRQGRGQRASDGIARRLERAQGRPARHRHRQPAGHVLQLGDQWHRVGQGPHDHRRRQRQPQQPHPDRCGDQPRQLGWPAAGRGRQRRRDQHRHRGRQQRHRLCDPHRHRPADHGAGRGGREAGPAVHGRRLPRARPPVRGGERPAGLRWGGPHPR